jgi:hypothetical protein
MSQHIRDRIQRKLATLSEDRLYQVLDFVEFLELKYPAAQPAAAAANPLQKFADGVEDRLRTTGLAASTVAEAMGFLNKAVGVLGKAATAAQSAAQQVGDAVAAAAQAGPGGPTPPPGAAPAGAPGAPGTGPATGGGAPPATPGGPAAPPSSDRPQ